MNLTESPSTVGMDSPRFANSNAAQEQHTPASNVVPANEYYSSSNYVSRHRTLGNVSLFLFLKDPLSYWGVMCSVFLHTNMCGSDDADDYPFGWRIIRFFRFTLDLFC